MSTIDLSDALSGASGGSFINAEEKAKLADTQEPMYVVGTDPRTETNYGEQTHFFVKAACWGRDEQRILAFSHNTYRETQAANVGTLIKETGKVGGPIYLGRFRTASGKDAWQLDTKPFTGDAAKAATTPAPAVAPAAAAPAAQSFDSDLPF
jgi:hypothetical protein